MNLIIGSTSQLSHYFPKDYIRISSRDVDFNYLKENVWDNVYLTFGEMRLYDNSLDFLTPNYTYTLNIIDSLLENSNRIVVYTSGELWNKCIGRIDHTQELNYFAGKCGYLPSKEKLMRGILGLREVDEKYNKVIMIHPIYFSSVYRIYRDYFLFGKIFDSILNLKKIEIGDTYSHRDIVHTKYVVEKSMSATDDMMVGSGRLYFVNDFIRDLYEHFNMEYDEYVTENLSVKRKNNSEKLYYVNTDDHYSYERLLKDSIDDINNFNFEK